jgi:GTP-dependent phosphoenolpyruvate carboxykinase
MGNAMLGVKNTTNLNVGQWIDKMAQLCQPESIFWCSGSPEERAFLTQEAVDKGVLIIVLTPTMLLGWSSTPSSVRQNRERPARLIIGHHPRRCTRNCTDWPGERCKDELCM